MANPYTSAYEKYRGMGQIKPASQQERRQREEASGTADILRMLAGAAPMVGTALGAGLGGVIGAGAGGVGAIPGAAIGASIGGGLGQAAGSLAEGGASGMERPYLEKQAERDRQIELLLTALGSRR